jgi:F-type H+-transporting ATPase subunit alpha
MAVEDQVVSIFAGTRGYLDKLDIAQVNRFEAAMLSEIKARAPQLLVSIRDKRELTPETEKDLSAFLAGFATTFA